MPDLSYYLQLVPSWNSDKPRFMNTLAMLLQAQVDAQTMLAQLTADFDLDTAIGVQLDMVGQWIGRSRWIWMPIEGVYFSFDLTDNVGFDQGVWARPYDSLIGQVALSDDQYRALLKFKAIANEWDSTIPSISDALNALLPGIAIVDKGDLPNGLMTMNVLIIGAVDPMLLAALQQTFFIKPSGVLTTFIETTVVGDPLFGFDLDNEWISGFDTGAWGIVTIVE